MTARDDDPPLGGRPPRAGIGRPFRHADHADDFGERPDNTIRSQSR